MSREIHTAARGFKWALRFRVSSREEEDEDSNERNGLLRSHLDQIVPVTGLDEQPKALAVHVEPKTVALKVSMHCHGCARKVDKQISKLQGVVPFKVTESKKVTVLGNVTPMQVLESVSKVAKYAQILAVP